MTRGKSNIKLEVLRLLATHNADFNMKTKIMLWTPIHWLSFHNDGDSLRFALQYASLIFTPDSKGYTPLDIAGLMGNKDNCRLLVERIMML
jgi:ankyrin repeat protein